MFFAMFYVFVRLLVLVFWGNAGARQGPAKAWLMAQGSWLKAHGSLPRKTTNWHEGPGPGGAHAKFCLFFAMSHEPRAFMSHKP